MQNYVPLAFKVDYRSMALRSTFTFAEIGGRYFSKVTSYLLLITLHDITH